MPTDNAELTPLLFQIHSKTLPSEVIYMTHDIQNFKYFKINFKGLISTSISLLLLLLNADNICPCHLLLILFLFPILIYVHLKLTLPFQLNFCLNPVLQEHIRQYQSFIVYYYSQNTFCGHYIRCKCRTPRHMCLLLFSDLQSHQSFKEKFLAFSLFIWALFRVNILFLTFTYTYICI